MRLLLGGEKDKIEALRKERDELENDKKALFDRLKQLASANGAGVKGRCSKS